MTAREMSQEQLAEVRAWLRGELDPMVDSPPSMGDEDWTDAVFAHVDAITADRDEARAEVAALRAQRDEIREAHRVDEVERDSDALRRMATLADEAQRRLASMTEAAAWYVELRARHAGANGDHAEGSANALRAAHDDLTSLIDGEPANARAAHLAALTARLEAAERERDEAQRVLCMIAPERDVVPPRLESAGPTKAGRDAAGWIITSAVRVLFMEMELSPPEKRNRLTIGIQTHDGKGQKYNLTLAKDEWESVMETQRDAARRERDALVVERDAAEAKLAALVEAVPDGTTVLCVAMVDACTSCERTFEESVAEDKCPSCGAEWCMTTYVGDPTYRVTHTELGDPKCLDAALRAARGEP